MRVTLLPLVFLVCADARKILVYNMKFAHSHSNFIGNIADLLVDAGHDVTSLIPEGATQYKDGSTKTKVVRIAPHPEAKNEADRWDNEGELDMFSFSELNPILPFVLGRKFEVMFGKQCEATLDSGEIEKLQKDKFDVYIVESFDFCGMMLSHLLKPRAVIKASSTLLYGAHFDEFGVPQALSYNPSASTRSLDVHSFISRAWNIYTEMLVRISFYPARSAVDRVFRQRFGADYPTLKEISSNVSYVFTNTESLIDFAAPTLTKLIDIGGLGAKEPQELSEYWASVMSRRPKVVLISFGSVAKSYMLAPTVKEAILKVVSSFPSVTFIWKYEKKDEFALGEASKIDNLVLTDWMPQNDLLTLARIFYLFFLVEISSSQTTPIFITHDGMGSVQELAMRGKPAILVPIFADQPRNAAMLVHNKLGKVLSKLDIGNHEKIIALLKELMDNSEYAENSRRVARMIAKKPFSSREKLLKHVEFAADFGPSYALRPQSQDMSLIEYHNLDVLFAALIAFMAFAYCFVTATCYLLRRISVRKAKNE